ncbi:hypothetical protein, partial [Marivirga sp.]|uniref:hypothetical protein n=1 Tax=Marivirga sp. TaxID=2018662 RepID=UPI0025D3129C
MKLLKQLKMKKIFFFLLLILTFQGCEVDGNPEMLELLIEIRNQNNELKEEIFKLQEKMEQLLLDVNKGNETNDLLKNQVDALTANLEKVLNELEALNDKSEEDGANIEKILKELELLQEKYLVILSQLESLQELQVLIGELEMLKGQISQLQEQSNSMLESIAEFDASLKNLEENISEVNSKISQALQKITALTEQLSKQEGDLDAILAELNKLKVEIEELKELLNQLLNAPKIGDFYKGGIVFYIDDSSLSGLVVAKTNQRDSATEWGCYCQFIEGIESELGTGKSNTEKILNQCEASESIPNWAAKIVDQLI